MAFGGGDNQATITINGNAAGGSAAILSTADALTGLQAAFDAASAAAAALSASLVANSAAAEDAGAAMGTMAASADTAEASLAATGASATTASGTMTGLTDAIAGAWGQLGSFIERAGEFVTAIAAWSIIQDVIGWVRQLSDELFNLNVHTEKTVNGWTYLFGGGNTPHGRSVANNLALWSSKFSMQIPFTRQDLMTAITTLGSTGLNPRQVETFMPYLSDIAATWGSAAYGGKGTTLAQAANAVRMASQGISRMLKYDLNINPEQLIPYGLVGKGTSTGFHITDPNSLYRALINFAQKKGLAGASSEMANTTWWGGFSSAVDRLQNFLLSMGGTNLNGTIRQGSFFDTIKKDLFQLMDWFDSRQTQINQFADVMSRLVGTVVNAGGGLLGNFFDYVSKLSNLQDTMGWITNSADAIARMFIGSPAPGFQPGTRNGGTPRVATGKHAHLPVSGGSGGAGGYTSSGTGVRQQATGIDWNDMFVVGGILEMWNSLNWSGITQGLANFTKGWSDFSAAVNQSGFGQVLGQIWRILVDIFSILTAPEVSYVEGTLKGLGEGLQLAGLVMQEFAPYWSSMAQALNDFATALEHLMAAASRGDWGTVISLLKDLVGISPSAARGAGGAANVAGGFGGWFSGVERWAGQQFGQLGWRG